MNTFKFILGCLIEIYMFAASIVLLTLAFMGIFNQGYQFWMMPVALVVSIGIYYAYYKLVKSTGVARWFV